MNTAEDRWHHIGRAAEEFARRVARDARKFAERVEEHVGEFAHDVRHEWHCGHDARSRRREERRESRHEQRRESRHGASTDDVRQVFEDIRGVLSSVLDGVDEFLSSVFHGEEPSWARVVCAREATCAGCGRTIGAGQEAHVRGTGDERKFRCLECGVPREQTS